MSDSQILADYNHDGRISSKAAEQELRQTPPGVIIVPNLDADGRRLPKTVTLDNPVTLDFQHDGKSGVDRELLSLKIRVDNEAGDISKLFFEMIGPTQTNFKLFDRKRREIPRKGNKFEVTAPLPGVQDFLLEAMTLPGSPAVPPVEEEPDHLTLVVEQFDAEHRLVQSDSAFISIAPLIFIDNTSPAERVYICEIPELKKTDRGNLPSIKDLEKALNRIKGVPLIKIPLTVNWGDAWTQDQFQTGYCQGPAGLIRVILHLPRLRSNVLQADFISNLSAFVPQHFPSKNLGVFQEFWDRPVGKFEDAQGKTRTITFRESYEFYLIFDRLWGVWNKLYALYYAFPKASKKDKSVESNFIRLATMSFYEGLTGLEKYLKRVKANVKEKQRSPTLKEGQRDLLGDELKALDRLYAALINGQKSSIRLDKDKRIKVKTESFGTVFFTKENANKLDELLPTLHDSTNYGGNIEISPPLQDAPFGKIVLGSVKRMDPKLVHFLKRQQLQPIVDIDTSWLHVAHADELISFLPSPQAAGSSSVIAYASPAVAMEILDVAWETYMEGGGTSAMALPTFPLDQPPLGTRDTMEDGDYPITKMLRGKYWLHKHPKEAYQVVDAPQLYKDMLEYFPVIPGIIDYVPGEGEDRHYDAALSVREFRYFGYYTNDWISSKFRLNLIESLARAFPQTPQLPLPILFDEVPWTFNPEAKEAEPDWSRNRTSAFLPNCVNMQIVNNHVLIPKPYGPRASAEATVRILKRVLPPRFHSKLKPAYFKARQLDQTTHWIKPPINPGTDWPELNQIARQFGDGFPDLEEEAIIAKIFKANAKHFDGKGNLRKGWRKLNIPEKTIDLFEAYIQIRLESLGLKVHWIDSWYYHIRLGEIHCGTNVLRKPTPPAKWWENRP